MDSQQKFSFLNNPRFLLNFYKLKSVGNKSLTLGGLIAEAVQLK